MNGVDLDPTSTTVQIYECMNCFHFSLFVSVLSKMFHQEVSLQPGLASLRGLGRSAERAHEELPAGPSPKDHRGDRARDQELLEAAGDCGCLACFVCFFLFFFQWNIISNFNGFPEFWSILYTFAHFFVRGLSRASKIRPVRPSLC